MRPDEFARQTAAIFGGYAGIKAHDIVVEIAPEISGLMVSDEARMRQVSLSLPTTPRRSPR